jgi:hypothetical protein
VTLLKNLEAVFVLCALVAWGVGVYEGTMFYRALRREKIGPLGIYNVFYAWARRPSTIDPLPSRLLAGGLSEESRVRHRRLRWAVVAFLGFLALGAIAHFWLGHAQDSHRRGASLAEIQSALGHSNVATTSG